MKFSECIKSLHQTQHPITGNIYPLISNIVFEIVMADPDKYDRYIAPERDGMFDEFGMSTLKRAYLLNGIETPQFMFMRVSIGIHFNDDEKVFETYDMMSKGMFIHATPTLFNAGTPKPQMSSCFLTQIDNDSIDGIYKTIRDCAKISKHSGGLGVCISNVRASGSIIKGSNGTSNGIVPMLRVFSTTARYVDQGGGKRKGGIMVLLEPWHADIFEFLDLRKNQGIEEMRARDVFLALMINDKFMRAVKNNEDWYLFSPEIAPGLVELYGEAFDKKYDEYVSKKYYMRTVKAHDLWRSIMVAQIETGVPYMLYKDACNLKSNQQNIGPVITNLCSEIMQHVNKDEIAVCNLASIALPKFVNRETKEFDFRSLRETTRIVVRNLNQIIDNNYYPVKEARTSNQRHRPIGVGVQGLADVFAMIEEPFGSDRTRQLNKQIFQTMYYAALDESCELAMTLKRTYESFEGSPLSKGLFQMDLWKDQEYLKDQSVVSNQEWETLRENVRKHGVMNSLLIALMPTASTSQILGNNECIEPYTSNMYSRRVLSGEFKIVNKHMVRKLEELGLWDEKMKNEITKKNGSIQNIERIPKEVQSLFKTTWELSQKILIDMSADRAPYVDQSQSLNIFIAQPSISQLSSMHFYGWGQGLKTGMYYLRTNAASDPIKYTCDTCSA